MKIEVVFASRECDEELVTGKSVAVIDVLRATSVITTALHNGASSVVPFKTVEAALSYANRSQNPYVTGGERGALKIEGFDYGNSPLEYTPEVISGKELIITTTNGTLALERSKAAENLYVLCFLNCTAVCEKLIADGRDILLVCAGTNGRFSADDCLCAGMCIQHICQSGEPVDTASPTKFPSERPSRGYPRARTGRIKPNAIGLDDAGLFLRNYYAAYGSDLQDALKESSHFNYLISKGLGPDIDYCLQTDIINLVPRYNDGRIVVSGC